MVKVAPEAVLSMAVPPDAVVYQLIVFPAEAADRLTVPVPHLSPSVPVGLAGAGFTVAMTASLVAETQPAAVTASA